MHPYGITHGGSGEPGHTLPDSHAYNERVILYEVTMPDRAEYSEVRKTMIVGPTVLTGLLMHRPSQLIDFKRHGKTYSNTCRCIVRGIINVLIDGNYLLITPL